MISDLHHRSVHAWKSFHEAMRCLFLVALNDHRMDLYSSSKVLALLGSAYVQNSLS